MSRNIKLYIGRQDIKEVILPVDLKSLQYYRDTIIGKSSVEKVTFREGTTKIPAYFFERFPDEDGEEYAPFYECDGLKEVKLPSTLKEIGEGAFAYCPNLKEVVVPKDTIIDPDAFDANCMVDRDDGQNLDPTLDFDDDLGDDDPGDIGD